MEASVPNRAATPVQARQIAVVYPQSTANSGTEWPANAPYTPSTNTVAARLSGPVKNIRNPTRIPMCRRLRTVPRTRPSTVAPSALPIARKTMA